MWSFRKKKKKGSVFNKQIRYVLKVPPYLVLFGRLVRCSFLTEIEADGGGSKTYFWEGNINNSTQDGTLDRYLEEGKLVEFVPLVPFELGKVVVQDDAGNFFYADADNPTRNVVKLTVKE